MHMDLALTMTAQIIFITVLQLIVEEVLTKAKALIMLRIVVQVVIHMIGMALGLKQPALQKMQHQLMLMLPMMTFTLPLLIQFVEGMELI